MGLFADILEKIYELFCERNNLVLFKITSTAELTKDELGGLERFLHTKSGKQVRCTCTIDRRLIAGIRVQSGSLLWEYSVDQKLRDAQHMALNGNNS
jgi:F0F1-type ATP synthase delta subunit